MCVHRPTHAFRKSQPGPPDYLVWVCAMRESPDAEIPLPDLPHHLGPWARELGGGPIPLKLAIVEGAQISFVGLSAPSLEMPHQV